MNILVTGGAGFIGSHTCVELLNENHTVIIVDNLINSKFETILKIEEITKKKVKFYKTDVTNESETMKIFEENVIDGVIHFAGLKAVGESVLNPIKYYYNNLLSTIVISKLSLKYGVSKFVFSSSATVYGDNNSPLSEEMELLPRTNPYGESKAMSERILKDIAKTNASFKVSLLRYFNPIGAHKSGLIGENPIGLPNNLMPYITRVAKGYSENLSIFGDDYDTIDGSGVRDYIHVVDLAKGHIKAIELLNDSVEIYNLGTGRGISVLELVDTFVNVNKVNVPYKFVARRTGDIAICYASVSKAKINLGWTANLSIKDMCIDSWRFAKKR